MPIETIIFIVCWIVVAILGGGMLVYVWQMLLARYEDRRARKQKVSEQSDAANG